jgi:peptidoglycan/xylan/chitin deacetylase (PgdA/CDA1 family)
MVLDLGLEGNLIFAGEHKDVPELLSAIDISVLSSLNEGFSNTILESMAAAKPVVATNTGGTPEAVVEGVTGFMVPPRDPAALAGAIIKLLRDEGLRHRMGRAGFLRVKENFETTVMLAKLQELYLRLLEGKRGVRVGMDTNESPHIVSFSKQVIKTALGAAYKYSGISFIIRKTSKSFKIFAYHRISDVKFDPLGMNLSTDMFESHIRYIHGQCNPISLQSALELRQAGLPYPENAVVLTFDDGYRNNYAAAFPLLKKYKIPATVFLSVGAVENKGALWYDEIVNTLKTSRGRVLDLRGIKLKEYELATDQNKSDAAAHIAMRLKYINRYDRDRAVEYIKEVSGRGVREKEDDNAMLTWDMVKEMQSSDVSFGSHGMTHSILTTMTLKDVEFELKESKKLIFERTGREPLYFAYPNGHEYDFNDDVAALARASGYKAACTLIAEGNRGYSPYSLNRYCVTARMLSSFMGGFSDSKFEMEMEKEKIKYIFSFKPFRSIKHV